MTIRYANSQVQRRQPQRQVTLTMSEPILGTLYTLARAALLTTL